MVLSPSCAPESYSGDFITLNNDGYTLVIVKSTSQPNEQSVYFQVSGIDELWEDLKDKIEKYKHKPLFTQPYGMKEFHIIIPKTATLLFLSENRTKPRRTRHRHTDGGDHTLSGVTARNTETTKYHANPPVLFHYLSPDLLASHTVLVGIGLISPLTGRDTCLSRKSPRQRTGATIANFVGNDIYRFALSEQRPGNT